MLWLARSLTAGGTNLHRICNTAFSGGAMKELSKDQEDKQP